MQSREWKIRIRLAVQGCTIDIRYLEVALSDHNTSSFGLKLFFKPHLFACGRHIKRFVIVSIIWQKNLKTVLDWLSYSLWTVWEEKSRQLLVFLFVFVEVTLFISSQFSSQLSVYRLLVEYITRKTTTGVGVLYWNDKNPVACFR